MEIYEQREQSFFWKCWKFNIGFENQTKNWEKNFFPKVISSELVALNCLYSEENTGNRQSMC